MGNEVKDVAETIKGIVEAAPIYQDCLQPAAQEIGKTSGGLVRMALSPISAMIWGYDRIAEWLEATVTRKLEARGVQEDQIITPNPNIAGQAVEALRFVGNEPSLRELYANLLTTAMDADTAEHGHPAFVEVIKQLSPDEAKLIKIFKNRKNSLFPIVDINLKAEGFKGIIPMYRNVSLLGLQASCEYPVMSSNYLQNLDRLGIISISTKGYANEEVYDELKNHPAFIKILDSIVKGKRFSPVLKYKNIEITEFGDQFLRACC